MRIFVPSYYKHFKCKAEQCTRTCCSGWEIDIDADSLAKYEALDGRLKDVLRENIDFDHDPPCFILKDGEHCPFLNENHLCELILETGSDEILCQICADHPRFRNYWNDRIEMGLGLACEEAARLIISQEEPMTLVLLDEDVSLGEGGKEEIPEDEQYLMEVRAALYDDIKKQSWPDKRYERIVEYLVYRHIADALYDDRLEERIAFVGSAYQEILHRLAKKPDEASDEELIRACVDFSIEVEYNVSSCLGDGGE